MEFDINIYNTTNYGRLPKKKIAKVVEAALVGEKIDRAEISIIFVDDKTIHEMNVKYLGHDYATDVITFPLDEDRIDGEIYISVDTAKAQSLDYRVSLSNELQRLSVHGTLHLAGYDDDTAEKRALMNRKETQYINQ